MTRQVFRSRLLFKDLISECLAALVARPARSALTTLGIVIGTATFVTVVGIVNTASSQISERFNDLVATSVTATDARPDSSSDFPFPLGADARMTAVNGVTHAGILWFIDTTSGDVRGVSGSSVGDIDVWAASAGAWSVVKPAISQGRVYDRRADLSAERVVVLGSSVARRLGVTTLAQQPSILIQGLPFTVVGIIDKSLRHPELLLSATIPQGAAETLWGEPDPDAGATLTVETKLGAAPQVAKELPFALSPAHPEHVAAIPPPDPRTLRNQVSQDLSGLFIVLALLCLLVGSVGIANTTLVAVIERTPELGLRRALGATGWHIALQTLCESAFLGLLGGLLGSCFGVFAVVLIALWAKWTATLSLLMVATAPLVGLAVGAAAGLYPAVRASKIQPTEALRS